jgi:hypothetical protein
MHSINQPLFWILDLISGPFATTLMTLAVAFAGLRMLAGYSNPRRVVLIVAGSFIIIGANDIAVSIVSRSALHASLQASAPTAAYVEKGRNMEPIARPQNPFSPYGVDDSPN